MNIALVGPVSAPLPRTRVLLHQDEPVCVRIWDCTGSPPPNLEEVLKMCARTVVVNSAIGPESVSWSRRLAFLGVNFTFRELSYTRSDSELDAWLRTLLY